VFDIRKRLGWKPEPPDRRDFRLGAHPFFRKVGKLPRKVSLRECMPDVRDQGETNSCTGFAIAALRGALELQDSPEKKDVLAPPLSPLFVYYHERVKEGTWPADCGAYIRTGMKVLHKLGCSQESRFPFSPDSISAGVPKVDIEADRGAITAYLRVSTIDEMRVAIARRLPVVGGLTIYRNWERPHVWRTGQIPDPSGRAIGGHAVVAMGYDDEKEVFEWQNSWGKEWGDSGFFWTSYDYPNHSGCDFWVVLKWR